MWKHLSSPSRGSGGAPSETEVVTQNSDFSSSSLAAKMRRSSACHDTGRVLGKRLRTSPTIRTGLLRSSSCHDTGRVLGRRLREFSNCFSFSARATAYATKTTTKQSGATRSVTNDDDDEDTAVEDAGRALGRRLRYLKTLLVLSPSFPKQVSYPKEVIVHPTTTAFHDEDVDDDRRSLDMAGATPTSVGRNLIPPSPPRDKTAKTTTPANRAMETLAMLKAQYMHNADEAILPFQNDQGGEYSVHICFRRKEDAAASRKDDEEEEEQQPTAKRQKMGSDEEGEDKQMVAVVQEGGAVADAESAEKKDDENEADDEDDGQEEEVDEDEQEDEAKVAENEEKVAEVAERVTVVMEQTDSEPDAAGAASQDAPNEEEEEEEEEDEDSAPPEESENEDEEFLDHIGGDLGEWRDILQRVKSLLRQSPAIMKDTPEGTVLRRHHKVEAKWLGEQRDFFQDAGREGSRFEWCRRQLIEIGLFDKY